jgi:hypothetical protein
MPSLVAEITRPAPAKKIKGRMNTPPSDTNQSRWMYSPLDTEQHILGEGMLQLKLGLSSQERWIEIFRRKKRGAG